MLQGSELELIAVRVLRPPSAADAHVVVRPSLDPEEGVIAVGGAVQRAGAVARGERVEGRFGAVGAAPDDADEEGAEGWQAGGYDGYGGLGGGPDGDGDVLPCDCSSVLRNEVR